MITRDVVLEAMRAEHTGKLDLHASEVVRQVAQTLRIYRHRGEYLGLYHEAVDCLERARFDLEPEVRS